jgi:hypothetical protein
MSNFEKFCLTNNIPLKEVVAPLERVLLRLGFISKPIGMLSYWRRSIWFSILFSVMFLGTFELILRLVGTSFLTAVPPTERLISVFALLCFGPVTAFFSMRAIKKHRDILITFRDE